MNHKWPWRPASTKPKYFKKEKFLFEESKSKDTEKDEYYSESLRSQPSLNMKSLVNLKRVKTTCCEEKDTYDYFKVKNKNSLNRKVFLRTNINPSKPKLVTRPSSAAPNYIQSKVERLKDGLFGNKKQVLVSKNSGYFGFVENNEFKTVRKKKWFYMRNLQDKTIDERKEEETRLLREKELKEKLTRDVLRDKSMWWKEKQFELMGKDKKRIMVEKILIINLK